MATTATRPALSDEALGDMHSLIESSDSVELKQLKAGASA